MNKPVVFLDMDGLLVNFHKAAMQRWGIPYDTKFEKGSWDTVTVMCNAVGITQRQFWEGMASRVWEEMEWMEDALAIEAYAAYKFGVDRLCLLSSPANEDSAHGKILWIKKHLPKYWSEGRFCLNRNKALLAHNNAILIDDCDKNVDNFREAGGHSILYPRFWNSGYNDTNAFKTYSDKLDELSLYYPR